MTLLILALGCVGSSDKGTAPTAELVCDEELRFTSRTGEADTGVLTCTNTGDVTLTVTQSSYGASCAPDPFAFALGTVTLDPDEVFEYLVTFSPDPTLDGSCEGALGITHSSDLGESSVAVTLLGQVMPVDLDGDGYTVATGDCDDDDASANPGADEGTGAGDGVDTDCDGVIDEGTTSYDDDGDGWTEEEGDCDDEDRSVYPSQIEQCNELDDDCDLKVDEDTECSDDDGDGLSEDEGDCNDALDTVSPEATESANNLDDDCDLEIDENTEWYDDDGDLLSEVEGDCDDGDGSVYTGATEAPDGDDDDCDGLIDEYLGVYDQDGDCYCEEERCTGSVSTSCSSVLGGDCDDMDIDVHPDANEECNGVDDNCVDGIDENLDLYTWYYDMDNDGYGDEDITTKGCRAPVDYVTKGDGFDCDDDTTDDPDVGPAAADIHPNAEEICDGVDNNCVNGTDDEPTTTYYVDGDGDSYGDEEAGLCFWEEGYLEDPTDPDCNDEDTDIHPGVDELCDGVDNNCDDTIDEGCGYFLFTESVELDALSGTTTIHDTETFTIELPTEPVEQVSFVSIDAITEGTTNRCDFSTQIVPSDSGKKVVFTIGLGDGCVASGKVKARGVVIARLKELEAGWDDGGWLEEVDLNSPTAEGELTVADDSGAMICGVRTFQDDMAIPNGDWSCDIDAAGAASISIDSSVATVTDVAANAISLQPSAGMYVSVQSFTCGSDFTTKEFTYDQEHFGAEFNAMLLVDGLGSGDDGAYSYALECDPGSDPYACSLECSGSGQMVYGTVLMLSGDLTYPDAG